MDIKEMNVYLRDLLDDLRRNQAAAENLLDNINHLIANIHQTRMGLVDNMNIPATNPKEISDKLFNELEKAFKWPHFKD